MMWTREKPTIPGWYWAMDDDGDYPECVLVKGNYHYHEKIYHEVHAVMCEALLSTRDYEWWMGPIEVPQPPLAYSGVRG